MATQSADPGSVLRFYQRFLAWRKASAALCRGSIHFYRTPEPILALRREVRAGAAAHLPQAGPKGAAHEVRREEGSECILAVFNLSPNSVHYTLPAQARSLRDTASKSGSRDGRNLHLPPWGGFFGRLV